MPVDENGDEYDEFPLFSNGIGLYQVPHHMMKISSGSRPISLQSLQQPLVMFRAKSVLDAEQLQAIKDKKDFDAESSSTWTKSKAFKKKSKQYFLGREAEDVVLGGGEEKVVGALIAPIESRFGDPDRLPWQLKDADGQVLTGSLEGSQSAHHVLFLSYNDGFKVIPVVKWYTFKPKANHRTMTLEEAEEKMKQQKKSNDRWLMRAEAAELAEKEGKKTGGEKPIKAWRQKIMGIDPDKEDPIAATKLSKTKSAMPKSQEDMEEIGMDFEDGFSDDDDINFGMDDQDEAKEAKKRIFGKGVAGGGGEHDDDGGVWKGSSARQIAKSLVKREHQEVYTDLGPENPYWSESDDDEDENSKSKEAPQLQTNLALEKAKKAKLHARSEGGGSPHSQSASPAPSTGLGLKIKSNHQQPAAKRQKVDGSNSARSSVDPTSTSTSRQASLSPPPPPSAAQVIKKLARAQKRKGSRGVSASPAPPSASTSAASSSAPSAPSAPSALSLEYVPVDADELTAQVLVDMVKSKPVITVREVVAGLKPYLQSSRRDVNVGKLKELMKTYCIQDKKSGVVSLKPAFKT